MRPWNDFAILCRTRIQMRRFEQALHRAKVPVKLIGGHGFFNLREVQDLVSLLSYTVNPSSTYDLSRIADNLRLNIGPKMQMEVYDGLNLQTVKHSDLLNKLKTSKLANLKRSEGFIKLLTAIVSQPMNSPYGALVFLDSKLRIREELAAQDAKPAVGSSKPDHYRAESFDEFMKLAKDSQLDIKAFLDDIALLVNNKEDIEDAVTISTIHAAKGVTKTCRGYIWKYAPLDSDT